MTKVILDCDPGMDDSMAIVMAVNAPEIELLGVCSTHGNYPIDVTTPNALKVLEMLGVADEIGVYRGAAQPLMRPNPADPFSHGADGQANNNLPEPTTPPRNQSAAEFIIETVTKYPGEVTYIATGPMTNLATALLVDRKVADKIDRVVAISGAFALNEHAYQNATGDTPQSEWNVYVDPEAAKIVYDAGLDLLAIGLDVATYFDVDFSDADVREFGQSKSPAANFLSQSIEFVTGRGYGAYCTIIDCMAVAAVIDESLVESFVGRVGIETESVLCRGMTVLDSRHHHVWEHLPQVNVARTADYGRFLGLVKNLVLKGE